MLPGHVEVGAKDYSTGFIVPGGAVGESFWVQGVCECAFSASFWRGGEPRACYEKDAGGSPVEDLLLEGTDAEAGIAARVEESQAAEKRVSLHEERELAEDVEVEDLAFSSKERFKWSIGDRLAWWM